MERLLANDWSKTEITPCQKEDQDLRLPKSWRPIAPGSNLAKIPERIMHDVI